MSDTPDLSLALELASELSARGIEPLLIGAAALAVHGYPRFTEDLDFGVAVPPTELREIAHAFSSPSRHVELSEPDANDPLGGVITVTRAGCLPVELFTRCPIDLEVLKDRAKSYGLSRDLDALLRGVGL